MPDLSDLDYAPLSAKPTKEELAAYRAPRETPGYDYLTGFDEQKAPASKKGLFGQPTNQDVWENRYRMNAFAEANGLSYVFRINPARWPGKNKKLSTLVHVLQGGGSTGERVMTCYEEDEKTEGAVGSRQGWTQHYLTVGVKSDGNTPNAVLRHRGRPKEGVASSLAQHFELDDLFAVHWSPKNIDALLVEIERYFPPQLLEVVLDKAAGYDLQLSGGWLYLMRPTSFTQSSKTNFDPDLLRERFEIAAAVGPLFAEAVRSNSGN